VHGAVNAGTAAAQPWHSSVHCRLDNKQCSVLSAGCQVHTCRRRIALSRGVVHNHPTLLQSYLGACRCVVARKRSLHVAYLQQAVKQQQEATPAAAAAVAAATLDILRYQTE
jgi:hypothetical protein